MDRNHRLMLRHTLPLVLILKLGRVLRRPELIHTYWFTPVWTCFLSIPPEHRHTRGLDGNLDLTALIHKIYDFLFKKRHLLTPLKHKVEFYNHKRRIHLQQSKSQEVLNFTVRNYFLCTTNHFIKLPSFILRNSQWKY